MAPPASKKTTKQRQMALIHGAISSDVQSALRRLWETMDTIPDDEWRRRERRWQDVSQYVDSHQLASRRDN